MPELTPPRRRKSPRKWSLNHGEADSNDAPSHRDKRSRWQRYFTSVGEKKNISRCRGRDRAFFPRGGTLANPRCTPSHDGGDSHCVNLAKMDFKSDSHALASVKTQQSDEWVSRSQPSLLYIHFTQFYTRDHYTKINNAILIEAINQFPWTVINHDDNDLRLWLIAI